MDLDPSANYHKQGNIILSTLGKNLMKYNYPSMYYDEKGDGMEQNTANLTYNPGDIVYVFYRNPHTQDVANIQEAAVVTNPENPNELALFLYETYYPLSNEMAVYSRAEEAEQAYHYYFGNVSEGTLE